MSMINNTVLKNMTHNGIKVKKWRHNGALVFSAGGIVTYIVDGTVSYTEEVDSGASCLSPTTFTPAKSGWELLGWREDTVASADVLDHKLMGDDPITLYAVYQKVVTLSYNGNGAQSGSVASQNGTRIFNASGNYSDPAFTLAGNGFEKSDHDFTGWDLGAAGASITLFEDTVAYAQWERIPAEAFYLHTDVLGLTGNITELENGNAVVIHRPTSAEGWWTVRVGHNGGVAFSYLTDEISNVDRKHCNRVKFSVGWLDDVPASINIGGIIYTISTWGEHIVDISSLKEDMISIKLNTGAAPNEHGVQITAPYFYGDESEEDEPIVAEPYSVNITRSLFTTEGDFEGCYSDLTVYEGQVAIWEFASEGVGTGAIMVKGLETKGCNRVKIKLDSVPTMATAYTLVGATNVSESGSYLYGTVSGTTVDIGISVTLPAGLEMFDSLTIAEISFYGE